MTKINIFWFRRDLRLTDNVGLNMALDSGFPVLPIFIFDTNITGELPALDPRISFIHELLTNINIEIQKAGCSVYILKGDPLNIWRKMVISFNINSVYINNDYEPYSLHRDNMVENLLLKHNISLVSFKDQVIFEKGEIKKSDNSPYTVFTPYKKNWIQNLYKNLPFKNYNNSPDYNNLYKCSFNFPSLNEIGFRENRIRVRPYNLSVIRNYNNHRDYPAEDSTSYLSPHLRFGTVSIRKLVSIAVEENQLFLSELIWREFFMQIMFNFSYVVTGNFKSKFDNIVWRNNEKEFERWCSGETGYPIVDAGMRQLNATGYMHNRVRMITAGFLCKHLLIDWRWGEAYFADKLLDYELSSNNGNWQWAAGTGCDAAPYFRVFNPYTQQKKFDANWQYIEKWCQDFRKPGYPKPVVDHEFARNRAIDTYRSGIKRKIK